MKKALLVVIGIAFTSFVLTSAYIMYQKIVEQNKEQKMVEDNKSKRKQMALSSIAFIDDSNIRDKYTCKGENISPPLTISGVPPNTKSLAIIMDDPDAANEPAGNGRTFDHWVVFNISPSITKITENSSMSGSNLGTNSFGRTKYGGPCPPTLEHTYVFKLYALDIKLGLEDGASKTEVQNALAGHILSQAQLTGKYKK